MTTAVNTTKEDLAIVLSFVAKAEAFRDFVENEFSPACDRLEAAGYPGVGWIACWADGDSNPVNDCDSIADQADFMRVANGTPGAADWYFRRIEEWTSLDSVRVEYSGAREQAVVAFDRNFGSRFPELDRQVSEVVQAVERLDYLRSHRSHYHDPDRAIKDAEKLDGRPLDEVKADLITAVRDAVGKLTGYAVPVA